MLNEKDHMVKSLFEAIQKEVESHHFYLAASEKIKDEQGKLFFKTLAKEELQHKHFLEIQYRVILKTGVPDKKEKLPEKFVFDTNSPIYFKELKDHIKDAHFEVSALSIGSQLELALHKFYLDKSTSFKDPIIRGFFAELATWESEHYHLLLNELEQLKDDYWSENEFAPF